MAPLLHLKETTPFLLDAPCLTDDVIGESLLSSQVDLEHLTCIAAYYQLNGRCIGHHARVAEHGEVVLG